MSNKLQDLLDKKTLLRKLLVEKQAAGASANRVLPIQKSGLSIAPLSFSQQRLWLVDQLEEGSAHYNMPGVLVFDGVLNIGLINKVLDTIINRHEVLRTVYIPGEIDNEPIQKTLKGITFDIPIIDLSGFSAEKQTDLVHRHRKSEAHQVFDLSKDTLLRVKLLKLSAHKHILLVTMHHIASDGWSMGVIVREVVECYKAYSEGREAELPELPIQYSDYAQWQRDYLSGNVLAEQLQYWETQLQDLPVVHSLPLDYSRPAQQTFHGRYQKTIITSALTSQLKQYCQSQGATLFMGLHAVFSALLSKYSNENDIVIGSPVANRTQSEVENLVGFFVNTLILRSDLSSNPSFKTLLAQSQKVCFSAYEFQQVPFELLVEKLQPERSLSHSPLFQVMLALQNTEKVELKLPELSISRQDLIPGQEIQAKFDLNLNIEESVDGSLLLRWEYNADLFSEPTIVRMAEHFVRLMQQFLQHPEQAISTVSMLSETERAQLQSWNQTAAHYPDTICAHQLFEKQVELQANSIAVEDEGKVYTYLEVNKRANQVAYYLIEHGVKPDSLVGLCMERSLDMVVAFLGILKAGGACVALDPAYPHARLKGIANNIALQYLVVHSSLINELQAHIDNVLQLDAADLSAYNSENVQAPSIGLNPEHLSYIIHTSGTTGKAKAVAQTHKTLVNLVYQQVDGELLSQPLNSIQLTNLGFDVSMQEFVTAWYTGSKLSLYKEDLRLDIHKLVSVIESSQIGRLFLVPSVFNMFAEYANEKEIIFTSLEEIIAAGEKLQLTDSIKRFLANHSHCKLLNHYGPAETHVATAQRVEVNKHASRIPIGKPLGNYQCYVVNSKLQLQAVGVIGELLIGGAGVAREYLNQPELSDEKFIANPLKPEEKVYKTGDLVRWLADGTLDFIGRVDHQVKIRGLRVELGEIEAALRVSESVKDVVVQAIQSATDSQVLVAYIVPQSDSFEEETITAELKVNLQQLLPEYMVPSFFMLLDVLPVTTNGKLNLRALPKPDFASVVDNVYVAAQTEIEAELVRICEKLFSQEKISITANFFYLGGHSLLATRLVAHIKDRWQLTMPLKKVFETPCLRDIANWIDQSLDKPMKTSDQGQSVYGEIDLIPFDRKKLAPLSFSQRRLWLYEEKNDRHLPTYNMPTALEFDGNLNISALEQAFTYVFERHEILRTCFPASSDKQVAWQEILPAKPYSLKCEIVSEQDLNKAIQEHAQAPFDLQQGPLLKTQLLKIGNDKHVLLFNQHHIITDGWSQGILLRELMQAYHVYSEGGKPELATLPIQYADYAYWQQQHDSSLAKDYWKEMLGDYNSNLSLPVDRVGEAIHSRASILKVTYPAKLGEAAASFSRKHNMSFFMTLLATMAIVLQRYSQSDDICIGTTTAGRNHPNLEGLIGFFINIIAMRIKLDDKKNGIDLLKQVKEITLQGYEHSFLPFEDVLAITQQRGDDLVPVMMRHQNFPDVMLDEVSGELNIQALNRKVEQQAKCAIDIGFYGQGSDLTATVEYAADLFDKATIERLLLHHQNILNALIECPEQSISTYGLLSDVEVEHFLYPAKAKAIDWSRQPTVLSLFDEQVIAQPNAIAIFEESGISISYAGLDQRSKCIAAYLRSQGVRVGSRVALCIPRSIDYLSTLLAIWRLGAIYIPLDPDYPSHYLQLIINDAQPTLILSNSDVAGNISGDNIIFLDELELATAAYDASAVINASNVAYIMYTSGSTGRPKGVLVPHKQLQNWLQSLYQLLPFAKGEVVAQKTTAAFAVSMKEMLAGLLAGSPQIIISNSTAKDSQAFLKVLQDYQVTRLNIVPSHLQALLWEVKSNPGLKPYALRYCITAGEPLTQALLAEVKNQLPAVHVYNNYGCTEINDISYFSADKTLDDQIFVPIGEAIANSQVFILDKQYRPVPIGVMGQLYVDSASESYGYWQRASLTAESYIPHMYSRRPGARLYATGDMARYLADGSLEYMSREDFQVKIRGNRIDIRQVEKVLNEIDGVKQGVVAAWSAGNEPQQLVAYYVSEESVELKDQVVNQLLQAQLPEFMVPSLYVALTSLPRLPNGKLNRLALPVPEVDSLGWQGESYIEPSTAWEKVLVSIWSKLLNRTEDNISVRDNFFTLGGHSLIANQVVSQLRLQHKIEVSLQQLFEYPILQDFAAYLEEVANTTSLSYAEIPLVPIERTRPIPLSYSQRRLWIYEQHNTESQATYNLPMAARIYGNLDVKALEKSLNDLRCRHEVLRTHFAVDINTQEVVQVVDAWEATPLIIESVDAKSAMLHAQEHASAAFDLTKGPLFTAKLLKLAEHEYALLLNIHHIISDGWSMGILLHELMSGYDGYVLNSAESLPALPVQYADYAHWQHAHNVDKERAYWTKQLANYNAGIDLPADFINEGKTVNRIKLDYPPILSLELSRFCREHNCSLFMGLLAGMALVLGRYSDCDDICIGTTTAGRQHPDVEGLIGFFVNILAIRINLRNLDGLALLKQVKQTTLAAYGHSFLPFEEVLGETKKAGEQLVPFMMRHQNFPETNINEYSQQLDIEGFMTGTEAQQAKCEMDFAFYGEGESLYAVIEYASDRYTQKTIERLLQHHQKVLQTLIADPVCRIAEYDFLTAAELKYCLPVAPSKQTSLPVNTTILMQFEEQATQSASTIAIYEADSQQQINYRELNMRVHQIAHYLQTKDIQIGDRVALCSQRSIDYIAALLAIWKVGAVYVPLDPDYPANYLQLIIEDAKPAIILSVESMISTLECNVDIHALDAILADEYSNITVANVELTAEHIAYIMYTSGSTGKPKGVMTPYRQLLNWLASLYNKLPFAPDEVVAQKTTAAFAVSMKEMLAGLLVGCPQVIISNATAKDSQVFIKALQDYQVTRLNIVPSHLQALLWELKDNTALSLAALKYCITAGEPLTQALFAETQQQLPQVQLWNNYGCTEINDISYYRAEQAADKIFVPIGEAITNSRIYVLDKHYRPVPTGVLGTIYVDSDSLSHGYWQQRGLTAEYYIPHLYSDKPGARLYNTGDMARYRADGSLEYMSREDFQIKIRGNRIDVRQVEKVLTEVAGVQEGVVAAWSADNEPAQLVAYYVPAESEAKDAMISVTSLRQALQDALPDFMVPSLYTELPSLPRLANGKLDRLSLPVPEGQSLFDHYEAPVTATEKALVAFCEDLLSQEKVSISANFFHIGGHSLLATRLVSKIRSHFQVDIALRDIFDLPDLRCLAQHIELAEQHDIPPLLPATSDTGVLSYAQQRLWVLDQIEQGSPQYNMPAALLLTGELCISALEQAFHTIVDRHSVLRSIFVRQGDEARQQVQPTDIFQFEHGEISASDPDSEHREIRAAAYAEAQRPFDLSRDCMLRVKLLHCVLSSEAQIPCYLLLITMHHIASDGWSLGMMVKELETLYQTYAQGGGNPLADLPVQYSDYAQWQRGWLQGDMLANKLAYWREQLSGLPDVHNLPLDKPRPVRQSYVGGLYAELMPASTLDKLNALAKQENVTLFMLLQTAFSVLLHRYSGETDIVVGTPIANREQIELESLIGFFMNNLVLRSDIKRQQPFNGLLQNNKAMILSAYANQQVSFESVVNELQPERSLSYSPLFQILFTLQNTGQLMLDMPGVAVSGFESEGQSVKYDLALDILEVSEGLRLEWSYANSLFHAETITRLAKNYMTLLHDIVANPTMTVGGLSLLSDADKTHLLTAFNQTQQSYSQTQCLHQLIERSALECVEDCALVAEGNSLSYRELNTRANQLAHYLIHKRHLVPDTLVGICLPRTADMVVAVLAVMKAGGAYVPLDPSYPASRLAYMLDDAGLQTVISHHDLLATMPFSAEQALCLDDLTLQKSIAAHSTENPLVPGLSADNLAYVIYTSGSTGKPKGVMIEHRQAVNFLLSMQIKPGLQADDRLLAVTTLSFDIHVLELYLPLISGAQLIIASQAQSHDPAALIDLLDRHAITIMQATPATWQMLCNSDWQVEQPLKVLCGGEALSDQLKTQLLDQQYITLWNMYGPTETTVWSSVAQLQANEATIVGGPIANTTFYVLDQQQQVVPMGVAGELYIGGDGLARGYLNRPSLTAEKFVSDPFSLDMDARLYRTGDLVSWLPDGRIKFLGRIDHQVKIRGFRIELGEIETALLALTSISETVVIDWEDGSGSKQLVAYCVAQEGRDLNIDTTRQALRERLPDYMVPTLFMVLEALPKHPNGKLNRKALPEPDRQASVAEYVAPETETETKLIGICESLLEVDNISIATDFFTLGGHSLLATRLVSQLRTQFGVDIVLRDVFEASSFRELAQRIETAADKVEQVPLLPVDRQQKIPLSYAQRRLWLFEQNNEERLTSYNMPIAIRIEGDLSLQALQQALNYLVNRHEILRTTFHVDGGLDEGVIQAIHPTASLALDVEDFSSLLVEDELMSALRERARQHAAQYFDIEAGPLLSLCLVQTAKPYSVLLFNQHHIISDGWSVRILLRELMQAYDAFYEARQPELSAISIQYADYAHWQHAHDLTMQKAYWTKQLSEYEAGMNLPYDRLAQAGGFGVAKWLSVDYPVALGEGMAELNKRYGTSLFMVLLAAMLVVLQRYTQKVDICVGTTIAGREQAELEKILGFFINILPLRMQLGETMNGRAVLQQVRQVALEAFENALLPFEDVLAATGQRGDKLVPVMLRHQNYPDNAAQGLSEYLTLDTVNHALADQQAKCEIDFAFYGEGENINVVVEYAGDLFDEATIRRMVDHHQKVLTAMINNIEAPLTNINILTAAEKKQLLPIKPQIDTMSFETTSVIERFAAQVSQKKQMIACFEASGRDISYVSLDSYSNQLAHHLSAEGVQAGDHIALCMPRSIDYIASLLAIWKLGAVYIPLDPDYPAYYLQSIVEDAQPILILATAQSAGALQKDTNISNTVCVLEDVDLDIYPSRLKTQSIHAEQLAYIMYTSGSTGKPKGVMVPHRQLLNWLHTLNLRLPFSADEVVAQKTTAAFAVSMKEFLAGLLAGCAQVILNNQIVKDSQALLKALTQYKVTRINLVPSHLQALLWELREGEVSAKDLQSLRYCITAGEPLPQALVEQMYSNLPWVKLLNNYGCTELNDISYYSVDDINNAKAFVPIGEAIENSRVYVLDKALRAVPVGVVGNIYVDTASMSHGYWQRSSLTAEHYIPHPYSNEPGARLYNTGDMARYLSDGVLEYMNREDFQIKIRGNRIDVRQVEKVLTDIEGVRQGLVSAWSSGEEPAQLVAYYVLAEGVSITVEVLREMLQQVLPHFMVPSLYTELSSLPTLANGKLNRLSLPAPTMSLNEQIKYVPPENEMEESLVALWSEALSRPADQISVEATFLGLGGDSLLSMQISSKARKLGLDITPKVLFENQTIRAIAALDNLKLEDNNEKITGNNSLLPLQAWFVSEHFEDPELWNMITVFHSDEMLSKDIMFKATMALQEYHDVLRSRFIIDDQGFYDAYFPEEVNEDAFFYVDSDVIDLDKQDEVTSGYIQKARRSISLTEGPLFKVVLVNFPQNNSSRIAVIIHHVIADLQSSNILQEDLITLWRKFSFEKEDINLPPKANSIVEFAERIKNFGESAELKAEMDDYWYKLPWEKVKHIPLDFDVDDVRRENNFGSQASFYVDCSSVNIGRLQELLLKKYDVILADALYWALNEMISDWQDNPYTCIKSLLAARDGIPFLEGLNFSRTIAPFVLTRMNVLTRPNNQKLIERVKSIQKQTDSKSFNSGQCAYQIYTFYTRNESEKQRLFNIGVTNEIMFNYLGQTNFGAEEASAVSQVVRPVMENEAGQFFGDSQPRDSILRFTSQMMNSDLLIDIEYSVALHKEETIAYLSEKYLGKLKALLQELENESYS